MPVEPNPIYAGELAELRERNEALRHEIEACRERAQYITAGLPVGILETDMHGKVLTANAMLRELVGRDPVAEGLRSHHMIHPDDHERMADAFFLTLEGDGERDFSAEFRVLRPDGSVRWVRAITRSHFVPDGEYRGTLSTWFDITDEVEAKSSIQRFVGMLNVIADPVMIIDEDLSIVYANPAAFSAMPAAASDTGRFHPAFTESWRTVVDEAVPAARRDGSWTGELRGVDRHGEPATYLASMSVDRDPTTGKDFVTSISRDITALKRAEDVLRHQARRDPLTGLPNRRALFDRLDEVLDLPPHEVRVEGPDLGTAVLFVDLDAFKPVNDQHGHEAGDAVLVAVAERIHRGLRDGDSMARIGGDEFVIVCEGLTEAEAVDIAERVIQRSAEPVAVDRGDDRIMATVGASVGVAFAEAGVTGGELVRRADNAVYLAKAAGRGRVVVWSPDPT